MKCTLSLPVVSLSVLLLGLACTGEKEEVVEQPVEAPEVETHSNTPAPQTVTVPDNSGTKDAVRGQHDAGDEKTAEQDAVRGYHKVEDDNTASQDATRGGNSNDASRGGSSNSGSNSGSNNSGSNNGSQDASRGGSRR